MFLVLVLLAVGFFAGAYFLNKNKGQEHPPIPFIEEQADERRAPSQEERKQPVEVAKEPIEETPQVQEAPEVPAAAEIQEHEAHHEEVQREEQKSQHSSEQEKHDVSDTCPNGHPLAVSKGQVGYPGGYYMCTSCQRVLQCTSGRWNCPVCSFDVCPDCKPIQGQPVVEEENRSHGSANEAPGEEIKQGSRVEEAPQDEDDKSSVAASVMDLGTDIKLVIDSKQDELAKEFRKINEKGKVTWMKTHFIFIIDCSGSMKGVRWNSVKAGYKRCLAHIKRMPEVIISAFTFDDKANPFVREKTPAIAATTAERLPFSGKGTNYKRALEFAINIIKRSQHQEYLSCILFLSDGMGGYPEEAMNEILTMREEGKKILFYTMACATKEDEDMVNMAKMLEGAHYTFDDAEAAKRVFAAILRV